MGIINEATFVRTYGGPDERVVLRRCGPLEAWQGRSMTEIASGEVARLAELPTASQPDDQASGEEALGVVTFVALTGTVILRGDVIIYVRPAPETEDLDVFQVLSDWWRAGCVTRCNGLVVIRGCAEDEAGRIASDMARALARLSRQRLAAQCHVCGSTKGFNPEVFDFPRCLNCDTSWKFE